jgi:hypothetical protein
LGCKGKEDEVSSSEKVRSCSSRNVVVRNVEGDGIIIDEEIMGKNDSN